MFTDEEILDEVKKIQYVYGLKHEIRYEGERSGQAESVAEHVYAMHILAHYFIELENPEHTWNKEHIFSMITWHDMDELETGDIVGYKKTEADREREKIATQIVLEKIPTLVRNSIMTINTEYSKQETKEAQFVKAVDKIEPLFHVFNESGKEMLFRNKTTYENCKSIKDKYMTNFPHLMRFNEVITKNMQLQGFFTQEA